MCGLQAPVAPSLCDAPHVQFIETTVRETNRTAAEALWRVLCLRTLFILLFIRRRNDRNVNKQPLQRCNQITGGSDAGVEEDNVLPR